MSLPHSLCSPSLGICILARPVWAFRATPLSPDAVREGPPDSGLLATCAALPPGLSNSWGLACTSDCRLLSKQVSEIWHKYLDNHYQVLSKDRIQQIDLLGRHFVNDTGLGKWQFSLESIAVTSSTQSTSLAFNRESSCFHHGNISASFPILQIGRDFTSDRKNSIPYHHR
jgi:hypothetical protein